MRANIKAPKRLFGTTIMLIVMGSVLHGCSKKEEAVAVPEVAPVEEAPVEEAISAAPIPEDWNFLIGKCVLKDDDAAGCSESEARRRIGAATYDIFYKDKMEIYIWGPTELPINLRKDIKLTVDTIEYEYDSNTRGVLVRTRTKEGCILSSLYNQTGNQPTVSVQTLELSGSCTEYQMQINTTMRDIQSKKGPSVWRLIPLNGFAADESVGDSGETMNQTDPAVETVEDANIKILSFSEAIKVCAELTDLSNGLIDDISNKKRISRSTIRFIGSTDGGSSAACGIKFVTSEGEDVCYTNTVYSDGEKYWAGGESCVGMTP
jgi:hypothetical protein